LSNQVQGYIIAAVASICVIAYSHAQLTEELGASRANSQPVLIPTAQSAKLTSLGFDRILADFFWLSFVGYLGDSGKRRLDHFELADRYIELIVGLDPQFLDAYWFAAFTIGGELRNPKRASEILEAGIEANPDSWHLPFIAGINQYLYAGNEVLAAKYYRVAAKYPGAPEWLLRQAQILDSDAPHLVKQADSWMNICRCAQAVAVREHARKQCIWLWVQVYKNAPNDAYRNRAREVLKELGVDVGSLKKPE